MSLVGLRAPAADRGVVAEPPPAQAGMLLEQNRSRVDRADILILDRPLAELRREARRSALETARTYLGQAGEPVPEFAGESFLMAGHQPELFHPGVWIKNFALCGLAHRNGVTALNLVIDSDAPKSTTMRVPAWGGQSGGASPRVIHVPFDDWHGEIPFEERSVQDETLFAGFAERVQALTRDWDFVPLLAKFWEQVKHRPTALLGERLVSARRHFERCWGCRNLELPMSRLLNTAPAGWFICHLLLRAREFAAIYNDVVRSYRRQHGTRSRNRPVPDLAQDSDWIETPFWGWRTGQRRRGRLFVKFSPDALSLRAGSELWPTLSLHKPVADWHDLQSAGYKIRTRALTTTLFARVFLADLFIHGIGGGIYDELTNELMRRFYGLEALDFMVLSATLLLPFQRFAITRESCRQLARELRDLRWNPQRHLSPSRDGEAAELASMKTAWISRPASSREEQRTRFRTLRALTAKLEPYLNKQENALRNDLAECRRQIQANQILGRRDYAFCLHPEPLLRDFATSFLQNL